jgi:hypothetical protein
VSNERENKNQIFRQGLAPEAQSSIQSGIQTMSAAERMKKEFGIVVVPAELVKLPSEGKIYSIDSGLHNRQEIEIKAMTTREEDILTSRAYAKKGSTITELIRSCVVDKSVDVEQLISGDRNALMVAIRITGYGAKLSPELKCPKCGETNHPDFDLSKVSIKSIGAEPVSPGVNEFECDLPVSEAKATFKLLTAKDEEDLVNQHERKKKMFNSPVDTLMSDQLKMSLLSVNGKRDRAALAFFVDNMSGLDSQTLREKMLDIKPDVDMKQLFECEFCDLVEEVEIPIDREFFWPRSRKK